MSQTRQAVRSIKDAVSHVDVDAISREAAHGMARLGNLPQNVSDNERTLSLVAGSILAAAALTRLNRLSGLALLALGAGLLFRGSTGHCATYQALDINTKK